MASPSPDDLTWLYNLGAGLVVLAALAIGIWRARRGRGRDGWGGDDDGGGDGGGD